MAYKYCSYDDVMERINVADNGFDYETYNTATIAPLQENAENQINAWLSGFYKVPLTGTIPPIINEVTAILTAVNVLNVVYGLDAYEINKTVALYQDIVKKTIKSLQEFKIILPKEYWIDFKKNYIGEETNYFKNNWEKL